MTRIATITRTAFILIICATAVWILMIGYFYRNGPGDGGRFMPPPRQVAAIVNLIEAASAPDQIETVLSALGSDRLDLRIEAGRREPDPSGIAPMASAPYEEALGRPVAVRFGLEDGTWISRIRWGSRNIASLTLPISLARTLVIAVHAPYTVTVLGLPLGLGAGMFGTLAALMLLLVTQRQTGTLIELAKAVDRVDLAGPPAPLPNLRWRVVEIRAVAAAFERLQRRLGAILAARLALIGGIAHDVRTFATRLRLRVDDIADEQERARAVADIEDMIRLLDDALIAGRASTATLDLELFDLDRFVSDEVGDRQRLGQPVDVVARDGARPVLADRVALKRILGNVIDNAIHYGRSAHLRLATAGADAVLTITDEGPGVAEADRETLFEPFTRLDPSRNRRTGGSGLGLAVTRTLVEAHDGSIRFVDAPRGAAVEIRLPLYRPGVG